MDEKAHELSEAAAARNTLEAQLSEASERAQQYSSAHAAAACNVEVLRAKLHASEDARDAAQVKVGHQLQHYDCHHSFILLFLEACTVEVSLVHGAIAIAYG